MPPPSSPDIGPLDLAIQGMIESEINAAPKVNKDQLMAVIAVAWANIQEDVICTRCDDVPKRLKQIVKARGGQVE